MIPIPMIVIWFILEMIGISETIMLAEAILGAIAIETIAILGTAAKGITIAILSTAKAVGMRRAVVAPLVVFLAPVGLRVDVTVKG